MQTYMEMLVVIKVQPEEGGGGTVCITLLSNCVTVLLKVHAHLSWKHVAMLM